MKKTFILVGLLVSVFSFSMMAQEPTEKKGRGRGRENMPAEQREKWEQKHKDGHEKHRRGEDGEMRADSAKAATNKAVGNAKNSGPRVDSKAKTHKRGEQ